MLRPLFACLIGVYAAIHATGPALAQTYPNKVIKLIVPAGPGGPTDILGRLVGDRMSAALGQPVVIFPNVPTMIEAGVPDYVMTAFFGVAAPAGTPAGVIARLNSVINDGLKTEALQSALKKLGAVPTIESPEQFAAFIAAEMRKWSEIGIKVD